MTLLDWFFYHHPPDSPERSTPPTGCRFALYFDPVHDEEPIAGSAFSEIVDNADGSSSFKTKAGKFISQQPNQRGVFALADAVGLYEKFALSGMVAMSWTRPDQGDRIYGYVIAPLPNAA